MRYLLLSVLVVCMIGVVFSGLFGFNDKFSTQVIPYAYSVAEYGIKQDTTVIYEHKVSCDVPRELIHHQDVICIYGSAPFFGHTFELL